MTHNYLFFTLAYYFKIINIQKKDYRIYFLPTKTAIPITKNSIESTLRPSLNRQCLLIRTAIRRLRNDWLGEAAQHIGFLLLDGGRHRVLGRRIIVEGEELLRIVSICLHYLRSSLLLSTTLLIFIRGAKSAKILRNLIQIPSLLTLRLLLQNNFNMLDFSLMHFILFFHHPFYLLLLEGRKAAEAAPVDGSRRG